nr:GLPGLI family protein [uncultured Allomuricauda sp.]
MLKTFFLIFFLFVQCFLGVSQNISGEVIYAKNSNFEDIKNRLNKTGSDAQEKAFLEKLNNELKDTRYVLTFSKNESHYTKIKSLSNDSDKSALSKLNLGSFKGEFYFNLKSKEAIHKKEFLGETMLVESPLNPNWNLLKEKKKILGYECLKAHLKIQYKDINNNSKESLITAWYSPELNIPFGPEKYNSLPGLILELEDGNSKIVAKELKLFDQGEKMKIKKPTGGHKITESELEDKAREMLLEKMKRAKH